MVDQQSPFGPLPEPSPELTTYPPGPTLESGRPRYYPATGERVPPPPTHAYPAGLSDDKPWRRVVWLTGGAVGCFSTDLKSAEIQFLGGTYQSQAEIDTELKNLLRTAHEDCAAILKVRNYLAVRELSASEQAVVVRLWRACDERTARAGVV